MIYSLRRSSSHSQVKSLGIFVLSLIFLFMFTTQTHAMLKMPNEASLIKIEENLIAQVHPSIIISSAWIIDFPSEVQLSFYQVIALVGEDKVEKTFFLDMNTYALVDEALIESYREQEANSDDPTFTITSTNKDLVIQEDNSTLWLASFGAIIVGFVGYLVFKHKQKSLS